MNLLFRVLSAVLFLPVVIYFLWTGGLGFAFLIFAAFVIGLSDAFCLMRPCGDDFVVEGINQISDLLR